MIEKMLLYIIIISAIVMAARYIYNNFKGKANNSCSECEACSGGECITGECGM